MLYGRRRERALIAALLEDARRGRAGVLVVRGEAGVGKHTLLADAAEQADDFRLLRATGVQAEVELPFAGLQQLLRPVMNRLERLPAPQAAALRGAFGLTETETNRFLIELGALGLLAEVAAEQPLLCLISQARWLDPASADALVFVARRLEHEPMVVLFAARDEDGRQFRAPGLPELRVEGLDPAAAGELLEAEVGPLAPQLRERLLRETGGNPLALLELPASLTSQQLAGREPLPQRLPLSARLQQEFLQRVGRLPAATRTLLLVAAAEDTGELATVLAAGGRMGIDEAALEPAEQVGLVSVTDSVLVFRHPLVRSAIYQDATLFARRAAHRALIAVLTEEQHQDRRAWHLAAATLGPDGQVAAALAASAGRARRRGGPAAAVLERAAALTPDAALRARRLVAAASNSWEAGHSQRAQRLLEQIEPAADPEVRAGITELRGQIELPTGSPASASALLLQGARLILGSDPDRATDMLVLATWAALAADQLDRIVQEISPTISSVPGHDDARVQRVADSLVTAGLAPGTPPTATVEVPPKTATSWPHPAFTWMWPMLVVAEPTAGRRHRRPAVRQGGRGSPGRRDGRHPDRGPGQPGAGRGGPWPLAKRDRQRQRGLQLARETGQHATAGYFLVMLAAVALNRDEPRTAGGWPTKRWPPPPDCGLRWSRRSPPGRSRPWS
jgi:AAA ATPase-like protein